MSARPNAELAWKVLDHIDAHPETWAQAEWGCGTAACFAGWAVRLSGGVIEGQKNSDAEVVDGLPELRGEHVQDAAYSLLGLCTDDAVVDGQWLFDAYNSRLTLGELVAEIFGPRPAATPPGEFQVCPKCGDPLTTGCRPADRVCVVDNEDDQEHCGNDCGGVYEDGERVEEPDDCVCCPCCCDCLGCVYAPQDGMLLTAEQRAGIGAGLDDVPPNAGSQS